MAESSASRVVAHVTPRLQPSESPCQSWAGTIATRMAVKGESGGPTTGACFSWALVAHGRRIRIAAKADRAVRNGITGRWEMGDWRWETVL